MREAGTTTKEMAKALCGFSMIKRSKGSLKETERGVMGSFLDRLRRKYTGEWVSDKREGRGTMFFDNEDRYDGFWKDDVPHGEGRMIYNNGDVYEGAWYMGKRCGYGVLTKRNKDHFEGHWVNDKRVLLQLAT